MGSDREDFKVLAKELIQIQKRGGNSAKFFHETEAKLGREEFLAFSRFLMLEAITLTEIPPWERAELVRVISMRIK